MVGITILTAHAQETLHEDRRSARESSCRAARAPAAAGFRDGAGAQAHHQRYRAPGERFEEDRFTRHQRIAVRARGNARAYHGDHQARRLYARSASTRTRVPALVSDRADL